MEIPKCPHCQSKLLNHKQPNLDKAIENAESYGSCSFVLKCIYCGKKFRLSLKTEVVLNNVYPVADDVDLSFA